MKSLVSMIVLASAVVSLTAQADDIDDLLGDSSDESSEEVVSSEDESGEAVGEDGEAIEENEAEEGIEGVDPSLFKKPHVTLFHLLPYCKESEGLVEVLMPREKEWKVIREGKFYPLGSKYRVLGASSRLKLGFGPEASVEATGPATFGTRDQAIDERVRAIDLMAGTLTVKLPTKMADGVFTVNAPGFVVTNMVGESRYTYNKTVDGDEATVRCVTQKLAIKGLHFSVPDMLAANEIRIVTSQDQLVTVLYGVRGDYIVKLDQGLVVNRDYGTDEDKIEQKFLDWKLSPLTSVRIHRAKVPASERMAVTVMTFDSRGELRNRCAFAENLVGVNSGELGPTSKKEREELAKRAAEIAQSQETAGDAAETSDADVDVEEDESGEEGGEEESPEDELDF